MRARIAVLFHCSRKKRAVASGESMSCHPAVDRFGWLVTGAQAIGGTRLLAV